MLLPDHDGAVHGDLSAAAGARAVRPARRDRRRRRAAGHPHRGSPSRAHARSSLPRARSARVVHGLPQRRRLARGDVRQRHPGLRPPPVRRGAGARGRPGADRDPRRREDRDPRRRPVHRRPGRRPDPRRDQGVGAATGPGRRSTSTSATRTRWSMVDDLAEAGRAARRAGVRRGGSIPSGVNVEFVVRRGADHLAMRVHERGSGETRSCGTGACAGGRRGGR